MPRRLSFGPFELDVAAGELCRHGIRVRLQGQALEILLLLLKNPGEVVTREQLRDHIWSEGTFVDFEHGLNAAINKLRRALTDSADKPRYIETVPGRGYRFIGALDYGPSEPVSMVSAARPESKPRWWRNTHLWERLAWGLACVACFAVGLRFRSAPPRAPLWKINRITAETGLSDYPAISPDGNLVAYSSDAGLEGQQDLYAKQVAGGPSIRLTFDGAGNTTPDFSRDGSTIVFRSSRAGGGIYEIPALGGDARLIARGGQNPRFSPDGSQVAYWIGDETVATVVPGAGTLWVVPTSGGEPDRIGKAFTK
jgi:DNA-binding winged helix-turn-helix (wHTH) protein